MKNQDKTNKKIRRTGFFILIFKLLILNYFGILPVKAASEEPVLSVVQSQENTQQWTEITKRLQTIGVKYCVIGLADVRSAADWGDRTGIIFAKCRNINASPSDRPRGMDE